MEAQCDLWLLQYKNGEWISLECHGRSKRSGWSGFGRTRFTVIFGTVHADNDIFVPAQLHWAITRARTMLWLQQLAVSPILQHKMISQELPYHPVNYKFSKCTFGQKKAVSHAFQPACNFSLSRSTLSKSALMRSTLARSTQIFSRSSHVINHMLSNAFILRSRENLSSESWSCESWFWESWSWEMTPFLQSDEVNTCRWY